VLGSTNAISFSGRLRGNLQCMIMNAPMCDPVFFACPLHNCNTGQMTKVSARVTKLYLYSTGCNGLHFYTFAHLFVGSNTVA